MLPGVFSQPSNQTSPFKHQIISQIIALLASPTVISHSTLIKCHNPCSSLQDPTLSVAPLSLELSFLLLLSLFSLLQPYRLPCCSLNSQVCSCLRTFEVAISLKAAFSSRYLLGSFPHLLRSSLTCCFVSKAFFLHYPVLKIAKCLSVFHCFIFLCSIDHHVLHIFY